MSDFPQDPPKFKQWADEECKHWPAELTILAYNTRLDGFEAFAKAYAEFKATAA